MTISISTPTSNTGSIQNNSTDVLTIGSDNSVSIDTNTLHVDATNNRVGIGTSSPGYMLDVVNTSSNPYINIYGSTTSDAGILLGDSSEPYKAQIKYQNASDSLAFATNNGSTVAMRIDSSGRVTTPYQPAFLAYYSSPGDITVASQADYVLNATKYNIGSHYNTSNGRFTAPISGYYSFEMHIFFTNSDSNTQTMGAAYKINGSVYNGSDAIGQVQRIPNSCGGVISGETTVMMYLNSGDYVTVFARSNNNRIYTGHTHFSGRLVG